jgi:ATP-dependent DNA ligase
MLPERAAEPFDSPNHLFELKWGGIRALAFVEGARLRLLSQAGRDITVWFPELAPMVGQLAVANAVLDGEIVALEEGGDPDMTLLRGRLAKAGGHGRAPGVPTAQEKRCVYQAYDLLHLNGRPLLEQPLRQRKQALKEAIRSEGPAVFCDYVEREGSAFYQVVAQRRLAGVVAKDKGSLYHPGRRTSAWQEMAVYELGWFVIGGYALGVGRGRPIAALLLGEPAPGGGLRYAGQLSGEVGGGETEPALARLHDSRCPFLAPPPVGSLVYWLGPELVCEVKFAQRESDGRLRFPVFVALRPDLSPASCEAAQRAGAPATGWSNA